MTQIYTIFTKETYDSFDSYEEVKERFVFLMKENYNPKVWVDNYETKTAIEITRKIRLEI